MLSVAAATVIASSEAIVQAKPNDVEAVVKSWCPGDIPQISGLCCSVATEQVWIGERRRDSPRPMNAPPPSAVSLFHAGIGASLHKDRRLKSVIEQRRDTGVQTVPCQHGRLRTFSTAQMIALSDVRFWG
jgi:hypothetical protein